MLYYVCRVILDVYSSQSIKIVILLKSFVKLSWVKMIFFFDFFWIRILIENHQKNWIKTRRCFNFDKNCLHIVSYFIFNFRNELKNVYRLFVASIFESIIVIFCLIFRISSYAWHVIERKKLLIKWCSRIIFTKSKCNFTFKTIFVVVLKIFFIIWIARFWITRKILSVIFWFFLYS